MVRKPTSSKLRAIIVKQLRMQTKQARAFKVEPCIDGVHMTCTVCGHVIHKAHKVKEKDPAAADQAELEMMAQARARPTVKLTCPVCSEKLREKYFPTKE